MEHRPFQSIILEAASPLADVQRNAFVAFHAQIWRQEYSKTRPARRLTPLEWACLWDAIRAHGLSVYPMALPDSGIRLGIIHRPDEAPDRDPVILLDSRHAPDEASWRKDVGEPASGRASGIVAHLDDDATPASGTFG